MTTSQVYEASGHRPASAFQGWILISCAWLAIMAAGLIAPVLPRMLDVFRGQPHAELLISLISTFPALFVALLAWPSGLLGDIIGHRRLLMWATFFYAVFGTAPMWLTTLPQILTSRALVGVAESAVMTCSVTLIGAYFDGVRRERYLALQTGTAPIAALAFFALGGSLGELNWRYPFLVYAFGLVLYPVIGLCIREPNLSGDPSAVRYPEVKTGAPMDWSALMTVCSLSIFAMSAFMITIIQLGFLLAQRGIVSSAQIGIWLSLTSLANPVGALIFGLYRSSLLAKLGTAFALMGIGFLSIVIFPSWQALIAAAVVANVGAGMVLPALSFCAVQVVPPEQRGMGLGVWTSSMFAGQFLSPLAILGLTAVTGTLARAVAAYGWLSVLLATALFVFRRRKLIENIAA